MQQLIAGIHKFQKQKLGRYQELFQRLSHEGQNPHTLFITCSDSRVLAELITQILAGKPVADIHELWPVELVLRESSGPVR